MMSIVICMSFKGISCYEPDSEMNEGIIVMLKLILSGRFDEVLFVGYPSITFQGKGNIYFSRL